MNLSELFMTRMPAADNTKRELHVSCNTSSELIDLIVRQLPRASAPPRAVDEWKRYLKLELLDAPGSLSHLTYADWINLKLPMGIKSLLRSLTVPLAKTHAEPGEAMPAKLPTKSNSLLPPWALDANAIVEEESRRVPLVGSPRSMIPRGEKAVIARSGDEALKLFRDELIRRGADDIYGINRKFKLIDKNRNHLINRESFSNTFHELGLLDRETSESIFDFLIKKKKDEIEKIPFAIFDENYLNNLNYTDFLKLIRGTMNRRRRNCCTEIFQFLDKDKIGAIEIGENEFLKIIFKFDQFINLNDFMNYYSIISNDIDDDDVFITLMHNAFRTPKSDYAKSHFFSQRVSESHFKLG
jgi:Ca2+-binding EF-hand superfamily protein